MIPKPVVPVIDPAQLSRGTGSAHHPPLDARGRPETPLVVVDLDATASSTVLRNAASQARSCDRLLVGVTDGPAESLGAAALELAAALDFSLAREGTEAGGQPFVDVSDPAVVLSGLEVAVTANPQASLVLAKLLRTTEGLPVRDALDVESLGYSTLLGGGEFRRWLAARGDRPDPPLTPDPVLVTRTGDVLDVVLNRPHRRNAYSRDMRDALVEALRLAVLDDSISRVELAGAGPAFCSGGDLDEFGTTPDLATAHFLRTRAGAGRLVHRLRDRMCVRLHGTAVGAGIELPAFAGVVTATADTTCRLPEVAMGLIPGAGGTVGIPRRIGRWRTLYLAVSGIRLDAATALSWGLVDAVHPAV
jgi:enoyl-CoA hydratase/isomerase-like protein